jgi:hypothetical protein
MQTETMTQSYTFEGNPVKVHHVRCEMPQKRLLKLWLCVVPVPDDAVWTPEKMARFMDFIDMSPDELTHMLAFISAVKGLGVDFQSMVMKPNTSIAEIVHAFDIAARGA